MTGNKGEKYITNVPGQTQTGMLRFLVGTMVMVFNPTLSVPTDPPYITYETENVKGTYP